MSSAASNLRGGNNASYKAGIVSAIIELKEHRGSSSKSIRERMLARQNAPAGKNWRDASFAKALKEAVDDGDLVLAGDAYKLSDGYWRDLKRSVADSYRTKPDPNGKLS